jgi:hypothetical protein
MHLWRKDGFLRHKNYVRSKLLAGIRTQRRDAGFWVDLLSNVMRQHLVQTYHDIQCLCACRRCSRADGSTTSTTYTK